MPLIPPVTTRNPGWKQRHECVWNVTHNKERANTEEDFLLSSVRQVHTDLSLNNLKVFGACLKGVNSLFLLTGVISKLQTSKGLKWYTLVRVGLCNIIIQPLGYNNTEKQIVKRCYLLHFMPISGLSSLLTRLCAKCWTSVIAFQTTNHDNSVYAQQWSSQAAYTARRRGPLWGCCYLAVWSHSLRGAGVAPLTLSRAAAKHTE